MSDYEEYLKAKMEELEAQNKLLLANVYYLQTLTRTLNWKIRVLEGKQNGPG